MPRQRKPDKLTAQEITDLVPAPYHYIYTGHDPADERLVTTLMLAGEALAEPLHSSAKPQHPVSHAMPAGNDRPAIFEDFGGLLDICKQIETWLSADSRREELLSELCKAFGDGLLLRVIFQRLFPAQSAYRQLDAAGKPILSDREVEVLREAAGDLTHKEMAEKLGIGARTVNRHLENIYKKLGVHKPIQAVTRAISMGYLDLDGFDSLKFAAHCNLRDFRLFDSFVSRMPRPGDSPPLIGVQRLAGFALLLLIVSGATISQLRAEECSIHTQPECRGVVCEVDAQGKVIRLFGPDRMHTAHDIAVAPSQAARHGFTSGNLFVIHSLVLQQGLNEAAITEFTPGGQFVRTFCGGSEIGTRLNSFLSLAFMADGRLLASSGMLTDALLVFAEGGATVRRFAEGCYAQICVSASGKVYATQSSGIGCVVKVFDSDGQLLQTIGGTPAGVYYYGLAVNSCGHVFVGRVENERATIEHYDEAGELLNSFAVVGCCYLGDSTGLLAVDALDRLIVSCPETRDVKILSSDGAVLQRFDLKGKVVPYSVAVGKEGRLWVCGQSV